MRRFLATLLIAFVALGPAHVFAQTNVRPELTKAQEERVGQLIDAGKAAYNEGRFADALESLKAAHEIFPHPDIVYRMALCHERLGEDQQAVLYYKQFLSEVPEAPERARIEKTIQVIEARISKSEITVVSDPEGAVVYIDDVANGPAGYTPTELPVKPGNYRVIVKKEGFETLEELVDVGSGQSVALRYQLKSVTGSNTVSGPGTDAGLGDGARVGFDPTWVILMGLGIGAFAASVLFYQPYRSAADNVEKFDENRPGYDRRIVDDEKSRRNLYLGLTLGTAAVGLGLLIWSYVSYRSSQTPRADAGKRESSWSWAFGPTLDGEGASVGLGRSW